MLKTKFLTAQRKMSGNSPDFSLLDKSDICENYFLYEVELLRSERDLEMKENESCSDEKH